MVLNLRESPGALAVHVTDQAALLGQQHVLVANNPRPNATNGDGVADVVGLRSARCAVGVGGSGFTQDIRVEMSLLSMLQRQGLRDPTGQGTSWHP